MKWFFLTRQHPPVRLHAKWSRILLLPRRASSREHEQVVCDGRVLQTLQHLGLVGLAGLIRALLAAAASGSRPAGFRDQDLLTAAGIRDGLGLGGDPVAGAAGVAEIGIEEGMDVSGRKIRGLADLGVCDDGVLSVDRDDRALVAALLEDAAGGLDGVGDVVGGALAVVDDFIADDDGIDVVPVAADLLDHVADVVVDALDVDDAKHDLLVLLTCNGHDVGDLIAVNAVDADDVVGGHGVKVVGDGALVLAVAVVGVRSVADSLAAADYVAGTGAG